MCIIIYSPDGSIPRRHLQESLNANPHGWGFMLPDGDGGLCLAKGISRRRFWKEWHRRPRNGGAVVFHARIATHGGVNHDNTHPFRLQNHPGLAFCHNGIIHAHDGDKGEKLSDTRLFARDVLEDLPAGFLGEPGILKMMAGYIGRSKLAFLDAAGEVVLVNEDMGHWYMGRWYSNDSYQPKAAFVRAADLDEELELEPEFKGIQRLPEAQPNWYRQMIKAGEPPWGGWHK